MGDLTSKVDVSTDLANQLKVPPWCKMRLRRRATQRWNFTSGRTWCDLTSDEARRKTSHDFLSLYVLNASRDLARMKSR